MATPRLQQFQQFKRALAHASPVELRFAARAAALAPWVEASLAIFGLAPTLDALERMTPLGSNSHPIEAGLAERAVARAFRVQPWLPGRCLVRALVQFALHRRDGAQATLVVGVRHSERRRVEAHAWVEPPIPGEHQGYEAIFRRMTG